MTSTDRRLTAVIPQGLSGKRRNYSILPYPTVRAYGIAPAAIATGHPVPSESALMR